MTVHHSLKTHIVSCFFHITNLTTNFQVIDFYFRQCPLTSNLSLKFHWAVYCSRAVLHVGWHNFMVQQSPFPSMTRNSTEVMKSSPETVSSLQLTLPVVVNGCLNGCIARGGLVKWALQGPDVQTELCEIIYAG